jgi:hypothetical protein
MAIIFFGLAAKGILTTRDFAIPQQPLIDKVGYQVVKIFAYSAAEFTVTAASLVPKRWIAETDSFAEIDLTGSNMSLMDLVQSQPLPETTGYTAPGFTKMNYYIHARILGLINNRWNVNAKINGPLKFPVKV